MNDAAIFELRRQLADPRRLIEQLSLAEGAIRESGGAWKIKCPAHAERTASCSLKIGADGTLAAHCFACGWGGNVYHLIAAARGVDVNRDFHQVLEEAAAIAGVTLAELEQGHGLPRARSRATPAASLPAAPQRPPLDELRALWRASEPVDITSPVPATEEDLNVCRFFARRCWWPPTVAALKCVRVLPLEYSFPRWWPASWAPAWRLAVLAYEPDGRVATIHARAVNDATPKTRWPWSERGKYSFGGLLFADAAGRELLQGHARAGLAGVIATEGITDFIAAAAAMVQTGANYAVLGGTSGSWRALARVPWPQGVTLVVATDHDDAGEKYAAEIKCAVPEHVRLRRWTPPDLEHHAG